MSITGGADVDLSILFGVSINTMAYQAFFSAGAYLLGSLASYTYRWVNRQLALSFFMLLMAIASGLLPFIGNLWLYFLTSFICGLGMGGYDSGYSIWLVEMWPVNNAAILQASLFVAGFGGIFGPLLVSPFVYGEANVTRTNETLTDERRRMGLTVPFGTDALVLVVCGAMFLLTFFIHRYKTPIDSTTLDANNNKPIVKSSEIADFPVIPYRRSKLVLLALCYAFYMPTEGLYLGQSASMWQFLEIKLTAQEAAQQLTLLGATFTGGRLLTALIALKLKPDLIMTYHYAIIIGSLLLLFFGRHDRMLITIGNCILGFGYSAIYPAFFAFTQQHLRLTEKICSMYSFIGSLVSLVRPLVLGQTFREFPQVIFIMEAVFLSVTVTMFALVRIWIWHSPRQGGLNN